MIIDGVELVWKKIDVTKSAFYQANCFIENYEGGEPSFDQIKQHLLSNGWENEDSADLKCSIELAMINKHLL